jgi:hypothetical protein
MILSKYFIVDRIFNFTNFINGISNTMISRDLKEAIEKGILKKSGEKRMTKYVFGFID